jgi:hypothetical protein
VFNPQYSEDDFQRVLAKCRDLPPIDGDYRRDDYVENLLITVLDFQLRGVIVARAMDYYRQHAKKTVADFNGLKALLATHPDTQQGNLEIARALWGYRYWNRAELLRRFVKYFELRGVTTQEQLKRWASTANFERDFKGQIKGTGRAIFHGIVIRQDVDTIQPDTWIHRFLQSVLGYAVSDETAIELLEAVALELDLKAYALDWRIWKYQNGI